MPKPNQNQSTRYCFNHLKPIQSIINNTFKDLNNAKKFYAFFLKTGLSKRFILASIIFRLIAGSLQGLSLVLLLPLAKGIITNDFQFVQSSSFFQDLSRFLPFLNNLSQTMLFVVVAISIFIVIVSKSLITYFGNVNLSKKRLSIASKSNSYIFNQYIHLGKVFYDNSNGSTEATAFLQLTRMLDSLLKSLDDCIDIIIQFIMLSVILVFISFKLYLLCLVFIPVFFLFNRSLVQKIRQSSINESDCEMAFPREINNTFVRMPLAFITHNLTFEKKVFTKFCENFEQKKMM